MLDRNWRTTVSILCMVSETCLVYLMCDCPISGSTGCSGLCPGLFEDVMFYDVFRVCTKDLNPISYCFLNISLIWWRAFTSPLFLYALPLCDTFLPICSVLFCLLLLYFSFPWLLLFATRSNSFSVSGDWQWWDLSQGGASEKKS